MTRLVVPDVRHQASYLAASECAASGEQRDGDGDLTQAAEEGYAFTREGLEDPAEFARFVAQRVQAADAGAPASRRTIEANGGVYEDSRNGTRRHWIAL